MVDYSMFTRYNNGCKLDKPRHPTMIEQLKKYPTQIASTEKTLLTLNRNIEIQTELLGFLDADIEKDISESLCKNDQQRKARRLELQAEPDYMEAKRKLTEVKEERDRATIKLNQLRNEFSVMKLELRIQIAELEAVA